MLNLELRLREHFATKADLDRVNARHQELQREVQDMELGMSGVKVELQHLNENIDEIKSTLRWFSRTAGGAVLLAAINILLGLAR